MTPARDLGRYGRLDDGAEPAEMVGSAIAARDAAHTGAVILGRALAATREPAGGTRQESFEQALAEAAGRPAEDFGLVLRWMAGAVIATAELASEVLDRDPGPVVARMVGIRSLTSRRGRKEAGVARAMASVVEGLACDLPSAEAAFEGLAAGLTPSGRHIALAWSAEVTVGLLTLVSLATGDDEGALLSQLAEQYLFDPAALLEECGNTAVGADGPVLDRRRRRRGRRRPGGALLRGGHPDGGGRAAGHWCRHRRPHGRTRCARRDPGRPVAPRDRRGVRRPRRRVAGASAVADAVLDELVDGMAPEAVRLVVDQAGAIRRGDRGVDPELQRWLRDARPDEVRTVVSAFAQAAWAALAIAAADQGIDPETYLHGVAADIACELASAAVDDDDPCPCESGREYGRCCGR